MQSQKWEYAFVSQTTTYPTSGAFMGHTKFSQACLVYLKPDGPVVQETDSKKKDNVWGQCQAWITKLGLEGYEMTGVTSHVFPTSKYSYEYWFKRSL